MERGGEHNPEKTNYSFILEVQIFVGCLNGDFHTKTELFLSTDHFSGAFFTEISDYKYTK